MSDLTPIVALLQEMFAYLPWISSSINAYYAVVPSEHPVSPSLAFAAIAALAAVAWRLLRGGDGARSLLIAVTICWLVLDVAWQWRLWGRLQETQAAFAEFDSGERDARGAYQAPFALAKEVAARIDEAPGRIIIATQRDYRGMATAYYLYPRNVMWRQKEPELPTTAPPLSGDYLLLHIPHGLKYDRRGRVVRDENWELPVEELAVGRGIALLRVR